MYIEEIKFLLNALAFISKYLFNYIIDEYDKNSITI